MSPPSSAPDFCKAVIACNVEYNKSICHDTPCRTTVRKTIYKRWKSWIIFGFSRNHQPLPSIIGITSLFQSRTCNSIHIQKRRSHSESVVCFFIVLVSCTQLYTSLCRLVGWSIGPSVRPSVGYQLFSKLKNEGFLHVCHQGGPETSQKCIIASL